MHTNDDAVNAENVRSQAWLDEVRIGGLAYISHLRRLCQSGPAVTIEGEELEALQDFLNYTEEHLVSMWKLVEECEKAQSEELKLLTQDAAERIRPNAEI